MAAGNWTITVLMWGALALAGGCASTGGSSAPIEDRAKAKATTSAPATVSSATASKASTARAIPMPALPPENPTVLPLEAGPDDEQLARAESPATMLPPANPAVQSLLDQAREASARGEWERAQAALERALKLSPDNAAVWTQLAYTHLHRGELEQAQELAERAQVLSSAAGQQDPLIWQLIAEIEAARKRQPAGPP